MSPRLFPRRRTFGPAPVASFLALALATGSLLGCATGLPSGPASATASTPAASCDRVRDLDEVLAPGTVVLFGEMHGTREIPALFADAVCGALAAGRTVSAGLEMPSVTDDALAAFLASDGGDAARRALVADRFWSRDYQDGRTSLAMLQLLEEMRGLREAGLPLTVFTFDAAHAMDAEAREQRLAERLVEAVEAAGPQAVVFALTGDLHARAWGGSPWNPEFRTMGERAIALGPERQWLALDVSTTGGTGWMCTGPEASSCGSRRVRGDEARRPGIQLTGRAREGQRFHGTYHVGGVTTSPPAVSELDAAERAAPSGARLDDGAEGDGR